MIEDQDQRFADLELNLISSIDPNRKVQSDCVLNYNNEDNTYNVGPSYAWKINRYFSLGTTLYIHHRKNQWILNQVFNFQEGDDRYLQQTTYYEIKEWGIKPLVGCMWSPERIKMSVGLTFSHTFIFDSIQRQQQSIYGSDNIETWIPEELRDPNDPHYCPYSMNVLSVSKKKEYPYIITLGAAYFPNHSLLFSGDIAYYTTIDGSVMHKRRRAVTNFSFGTEYYWKESLALRVGAFTDFANTYEIDRGKENQSEHINIYGGSMSISYFAKGSSLTLGMVYKYGSGEAQVQGGYHVQKVTTSSIMGYVGSSYSF